MSDQNDKPDTADRSGGTACSVTYPEPIAQLIDRCEANESSFDNADMSLALKFGERLWRRLTRMIEHYERMSGNFMPDDIRGPMMAQAAKDFGHILSDTEKDL